MPPTLVLFSDPRSPLTSHPSVNQITNNKTRLDHYRPKGEIRAWPEEGPTGLRWIRTLLSISNNAPDTQVAASAIPALNLGGAYHDRANYRGDLSASTMQQYITALQATDNSTLISLYRCRWYMMKLFHKLSSPSAHNRPPRMKPHLQAVAGRVGVVLTAIEAMRKTGKRLDQGRLWTGVWKQESPLRHCLDSKGWTQTRGICRYGQLLLRKGRKFRRHQRERGAQCPVSIEHTENRSDQS